MNRKSDDSDETDVGAVLDQLDTLEETVDSEDERRAVSETRQLVTRLPHHLPGQRVFGKRIQRYTTRDMAEAFVGSVILALPLLVEDGVYDIADHMAETALGGIPVFFVANVLFVTAVVAGLLYYADIQRVEIHRPLFGVMPRRLVGVLVISFATATVMMTMWGRVGNWEDPWIAVCRISVIWTAGAFGAALGDILPGESSEPIR